MPAKTTDDLVNEIKRSDNIDKYLSQNEDELLCTNISNELNSLLREKNLIQAEVIKKSGLQHNYADQIFSGVKKGSRNKILALCFGMELNFTETQTLLKRISYNLLYARDKRDSIIIHSLEHRKSVVLCNIELDNNGFAPLD